jgi:hypothetical protein
MLHLPSSFPLRIDRDVQSNKLSVGWNLLVVLLAIIILAFTIIMRVNKLVQFLLELLGLAHRKFSIISNKSQRPIHAWWVVTL